MELVLALVLLSLIQGALYSQVEHVGELAVLGFLVLGLTQLLAVWFFRSRLPRDAIHSIVAIPTINVSAKWIFFTIVIGGLVQTADVYFFAPRSADLAYLPFAQSVAGWLAIGFVSPVVEEILFRACIISLLTPRFNGSIAIVLSAILFGGVHGNLVQGIQGFALGLAFGLAYVSSGSILPGVIGHVAVNMSSLFLLRSTIPH